MANLPKPAGLSIVWSGTGTKVNPGESKYNTGHVVELPPYETMNWIDWRQDAAIAHINQHGIPQWDAATEYQGNISITKGSNGLVYKALVTNTNVDPINPLSSATWVLAFEIYGAAAIVQAQLTDHLNNYDTLAGIGNTPVARVNLSVWSRAEADARYAALAGNAAQTFSVAAATAPEHAVRLGQVAGLLTQATEATLGVAMLATNAKAAAGTDDLTIMTPLKSHTVLLSKSGNLAGLGNVATARSNLGLGTIAIEAATGFLRTTNNLSDVSSVSAARANLGLTSTATQPEAYFLRTANNLSEVPDKAVARTNLGLTTTATTALATILLKADNLAGLGSTAAARSNLGLGSMATETATTYMRRDNNLQDVANVQGARNNLGLGNLSTRNVFGVNGDLDFTNAPAPGAGYARLPGGMTLQWGIGPALGDDSAVYQGLILGGQIMSVQITGIGGWANGVGPCFLSDEWSNTSFRVSNNYNSGPARPFTWLAMVYTG